MGELKREYEEKLQEVADSVKMSEGNVHLSDDPKDEAKITDRIRSIKDILIGGERANDTQLKEKRYKKKLAAQKKLKWVAPGLNFIVWKYFFRSALGSLLGRLEQTEDRDLLQAHYTDIHHEIIAKTELLKQQRQKIRSLEREIVDLQGEFQLDRTDYLESVRRLEKRNKFYEQFFEKISPILKRDGRVWNIDYIKNESTWVDDLKKWKIPESLIMHVKLPPATSHSPRAPSSTESLKSRDNNTSLTAPARLECLTDSFESDDSSEKQKDIDLALTYFRPKRIEKLIHQSRTWKDLSQQSLNVPKNNYDEIMNKTWYAGGNFFKKSNQHPWNMNLNGERETLNH